ncbi:hypothetical protein E4U48_003582 [Claviceps purpurea]|nr:hypothetical protein E4U48_003582 [Claviceps purpurea]
MASFRKIASLCGGRWVGCVAEGLASISLKAESDKMIKITMTSEQRVGGGEAAHWHLGGDNVWRPNDNAHETGDRPAFTFHAGHQNARCRQLGARLKAAQAAAENSKWCIP